MCPNWFDMCSEGPKGVEQREKGVGDLGDWVVGVWGLCRTGGSKVWGSTTLGELGFGKEG